MFWNKGKPKASMSESTVTNVLHAMELGAWAKYIKTFLFLLIFFVLLLIYQSNQFRGLELPEAMDNAQLARNIARGEGFTTDFIRPISAWKLREFSGDAKLKDANHPETVVHHPDLFNAPLFPYTVAAGFKLPYIVRSAVRMKFQSGLPSFEVISPPAPQPFTKFPPETTILAVCEFFFIASAALIYLLARQLFEKRIAMISVLIFLVSDDLWRYSISGLPTTMLVFLFLCAQICLVNAHLQVMREGKNALIWGLSAGAGLFCGLCLLTKYSVGWLIIPVLIYSGFALGKQRWICLGLTAFVFIVVISPWLVRNDRLTGKWFGLAGLSVIEQTEAYPNDQLERSFKAIAEPSTKHAQKKFLIQAREFAETGWQKAGAGLVTVFFLVSLLYRYKKTEVLYFRRFVLWAAVLAAIVSCFGSVISVAKDLWPSPINLTIVLSPGIIIIGVAFFYLLFDRVNLQIALLKHAAVALFVIVCAAPLVFSLLPPRRPTVRYPTPPYYEPVISGLSKLIHPEEIMMTDMPWAVAWYGDRRAMWMPNTLEEFFQIDLFEVRMAGLFLTPFTLNQPFNEFLRSMDELRQTQKPSWILLATGQLPEGFRLKSVYPVQGFGRDMLLFSDSPRWAEQKK